MRAGRAAVVSLMLLGAPLALAEAAEEERQCLLSLANGDQVRGELEMLADGRLSLRPAVAPGNVIRLDLEEVERLAFDRKGEAREADEGEVLKLRDGSILHGKFIALTERSLRFDLEEIGPVEFPRNALEKLSRTEDAATKVGPGPKHDVVATLAGDVLVGRLEQMGDGLLVVRGGAVEAAFPYASVAAVFFPSQADGGGAPDERRRITTVTTCKGARIIGSNPRVEGGRVSLTLVGDQRVSLPVGRVAAMAFTVGGGSLRPRRILAWGCYSDRDQEFPRTVAILKEHFGGRWQVTENFSSRFDDEFRAALRRCGALVVPEMEKWNASVEAQAPELRKLAESFLRRGGNVVLLGVRGNQTDFLRAAGLLDVTMSGSTSGAEVLFTDAGLKIAEGVGKSFRITNSTQFYRIGSGAKAVSLARNTAGSPIVARPVGLGWVVLLGMDYYECNDQTKRLLINAVTLR